jgi:DNA polymerase-1
MSGYGFNMATGEWDFGEESSSHKQKKKKKGWEGEHGFLLVDGDVIAYKAAAAAEKVIFIPETGLAVPYGKLVDAFGIVEGMMNEVSTALLDDAALWHGGKDVTTWNSIFCFSCPRKDNFRLAINPAYKKNREGKPRPVLLPFLIDEMRRRYFSWSFPSCEADDCLGYFATNGHCFGDNRIIVSIDKDMKTIPGLFYDMDKKELVEVREYDAMRAFLIQVLMGDAVDGYGGCKGIGKVRAERLVDAHFPVGGPVAVWKAILEAYEKAGQTYDDALLTARMAYILRKGDISGGSPSKLWTPEKLNNYRGEWVTV